MLNPNKTTFLLIWPRCFITFIAILELLAVIMFFLTELCSVAANFWTTNVFAGGWCGLIALIHVIALFVTGLCLPGPASAFRAALITMLLFIACAALISFDIVFLIRPTTCILTPSCADNAVSTTIFSYNFRKSFFQTFNSWGPFTSYSESQVKLLCEAIQLGLAGLCIIIGVIYLVIYFECLRKIKKHHQVGPNVPGNNNTPLGPPITPAQIYMSRPPPHPSQQAYMVPPQPAYYAPPPPVQPPYYAPPPPVQPAYYAPPQQYQPAYPR
ncbi:unnamed protein product [Adineta steineri]|uniref:MARVEL domain-containing protein n=1 Tax=Adineta steineri TaxID=433720 RepID=A0A818W398_9BILA|nr:unnamed protein product [Adineta steineri]CAF3719900.1 unnamed protein product [Adineta steineri]